MGWAFSDGRLKLSFHLVDQILASKILIDWLIFPLKFVLLLFKSLKPIKSIKRLTSK
jgi:hypothetical protein